MTTAPLPIRTLGTLAVPAIGYGAMVLSPGMYGDIDDDRAVTALRHAVDAGATFIDTSDGYGAEGHNERIVGAAVAGRRDEVVIATKFGFNRPAGVEGHRFPVGYSYGELAVDADPRHLRGYAEASLQRLGSRTPAHIDENLAAAHVELTEDVLEELTLLLAAAAPVGGALL